MISILGINITKSDKKEVFERIGKVLDSDKQAYIVTPNPEIVLEAQKDEELFYILNHAAISVPDGIGLKFAALLMGKKLNRYAGSDLVKEILEKAEKEKMKLAIANWERGLSNKDDIEDMLRKKYPSLLFLIEDMDRTGWAHEEIKKEIYKRLDNLNIFQPEILLCTFGSPYQEKFIYHALKKLHSVKLGIAIGGSLDFLTGKIKRAPKIMRQIGIEWLWRLIKQPKRIKRIFNAVIVFSLKFLKWRFFDPFLYRNNVAILMYKNDNGKYKIFLVERSDRWHGHWQLPQGGTNNEDLKEAGARELREEAGTDKFKVIASFPNLWKYKFRPEDKKAVKHVYGYKGQRQGLIITEFFGNDSDIRINYWDHRAWKWVEADKIIDVIHPVRREATKIYYEKFMRVTHNS